MNWIKRHRAWLFLVVLALVCAIPVGCHYRLKRQVEDYARQLEATGEKMNSREIAPVPRLASLRAADEFVRAVNSLPDPAAVDLHFRTYLPRPGVEIILWKEDDAIASTDGGTWTSVAERLRANRAAMDGIRRNIQREDLAFDLDYGLGYQLTYPHTQVLTAAAQWLRAELLVALHAGQSSEAFDALHALILLVQRCGNEPTLMTEKTRSRLSRTAMSSTWQALQSTAWTETQLKALQAAWEAVTPLQQTEQALRMERVFFCKLLRDARTANPLRNGCCGPPDFFKAPLDRAKYLWEREVGYLFWRLWQSYEDELVNMMMFQAGIEAAGRCRIRGCFEPAIRELSGIREWQRRNYPRAGAWAGLSMADVPVRALEETSMVAVGRELTVVAIALQRYHLAHGEYPDSLERLCPVFLRVAPVDPVDGEPLRYKPERGGFQLYSIGLDGKDNLGKPAIFARAYPALQERGTDVAWPRPATDEQLSAVRRQCKSETVPVGTPFDEAARRRFLARYGLAEPGTGTTNRQSR